VHTLAFHTLNHALIQLIIVVIVLWVASFLLSLLRR
jgi:hypothetical protein